MTEAELQAIRERCEAASGGWWFVTDHGIEYTVNNGADGGGILINRDGYDCLTDADEAFIVGAREDIPLLLAEVDRLRLEIDRQTARETILRQEIDAFIASRTCKTGR